MIQALLNRTVRPLALRIRHLLVRGIVKLVDDSTGIQTVQVALLQGEVRDGVPRLQPYGLTSVPLSGAEILILSLGGLREQAVAIDAGDRRYRVRNLVAGEVELYTDEGDSILLGRSGRIVVSAGSRADVNSGGEVNLTAVTKVTIGAGGDVEINSATQLVVTAPLVSIDGDLEVTGEITDRAGTNDVSMTDIRQAYNNHTHIERNVFGAPTDPPNTILSN